MQRSGANKNILTDDMVSQTEAITVYTPKLYDKITYWTGTIFLNIQLAIHSWQGIESRWLIPFSRHQEIHLLQIQSSFLSSVDQTLVMSYHPK